jgi:hypothetical protein
MAGSVFVEGYRGRYDTWGDAVQKLMRDLDEEAAKHGQAIVGEVTISEFEHTLMGACIRLDAQTAAR